MGKYAALGVLLGLIAGVRNSWAFITPLPASLAPDVLSETVPTALSPGDFAAEDFAVDWEGPPAEGVKLRLAPESLQWVRVADVLELPRARLIVTMPGASADDRARVSNAGFSQALAAASGPPGSPAELRAELPVALLSGAGNPLEITGRRGGRAVSGRAVIRFAPRASLGPERVFLDPSCSRFGMRAEGSAQGAKARGWTFVGCRAVEALTTGHRTSSLEAIVYWDGVGQSIEVGGVATPASSVSTWPLRLRSQPGEITLRAPSGDALTLRYGTPENYHYGFLGMGIGPYTEHFKSAIEDDSALAPVLTFYAAYFIDETNRIVAFDATTLDKHLTTDFGAYVSTQSLKILDRRLTANLLLGAHVIGFRSDGAYNFFPGLPQGLELSYLDAFRPGSNLTGGFFLYPLINGTSYYNIWLRWGSPKFFGEFNYISWQQPLNQLSVTSTSAGVSIGFPLARFF